MRSDSLCSQETEMNKTIVSQNSESWKTIPCMDPMTARAVMRLMYFHVGRLSAIKKPDAIVQLRDAGFQLDERQFRSAVNCLRKHGVLIGSASSHPMGYWLIANRDEYHEFIQREILSRIKDLREIQLAMDASANQVFGVKQYKFFEDKGDQE